jgi:hypothetical protein
MSHKYSNIELNILRGMLSSYNIHSLLLFPCRAGGGTHRTMPLPSPRIRQTVAMKQLQERLEVSVAQWAVTRDRGSSVLRLHRPPQLP